MENHTAPKSELLETEDVSVGNHSNDIHSNQLKNFAASRIQAVKSLATILMKELELLETLTTKPNEVIKKEEISLNDAVAHFEAELIRTALMQTKGHQRNAARLLGTKVTTLNMKMKRYGIDCREFTLFESEYNN